MNRRSFIQKACAVFPLSMLPLARRKQPRFVVKFDGKPMFNSVVYGKMIVVDATYAVRGSLINMKDYRKVTIHTPEGWRTIET